MTTGNTYVLSDIHGQYAAFLQMLDTIRFQPQDTLYILGDVLDRGDASIPLLQDVMARPNVELLLGNHELLALVALSRETGFPLAKKTVMRSWMQNGGGGTYQAFCALDADAQTTILAYLQGCALTKPIAVAGRTYVLAHAYLPALYDPQCQDFWENLCAMTRITKDVPLVPQGVVLSGHTPTHRICASAVGRILRGRHNVFLDCGPTQLGCLRLDDLQEFYVAVD